MPFKEYIQRQLQITARQNIKRHPRQPWHGQGNITKGPHLSAERGILSRVAEFARFWGISMLS